MNKDPDLSHKPGLGHEERDTNIRAILWFAAGLVATLVAVLLLTKWMFHAFPEPQGEAGLPSAQIAAQSVPPEPRLQVNAPEDLKNMREREDRALDSYGWVDRESGIVRIPIQRAIDLLAERGLPPRPPAVERSQGKR